MGLVFYDGSVEQCVVFSWSTCEHFTPQCDMTQLLKEGGELHTPDV